jgi:hypothetical protein
MRRILSWSRSSLWPPQRSRSSSRGVFGPCSREPRVRITIPPLSPTTTVLLHTSSSSCSVTPRSPGGRARRRIRRRGEVAHGHACARGGGTGTGQAPPSLRSRQRWPGAGSCPALAPARGGGAGASSTETVLAAATTGGGAPPRSRLRPRAAAVAEANSTELVLLAVTVGGGAPSSGGAMRRRRKGRSSPARPSNCSMQCRKGRTEGNFTSLYKVIIHISIINQTQS